MIGSMYPQLAKLFRAYGIFLIAMGFIGWAASGFSSTAITAIFSGGLSGLVMFGMGTAAAKKDQWASLARYVGFAFTLLFAGVFTWRTLASIGEHGTEDFALYKVIVIGTMMVVSYAVLLTSVVLHLKLRASGPEQH